MANEPASQTVMAGLVPAIHVLLERMSLGDAIHLLLHRASASM
jgi:hypothetical protein